MKHVSHDNDAKGRPERAHCITGLALQLQTAWLATRSKVEQAWLVAADMFLYLGILWRRGRETSRGQRDAVAAASNRRFFIS